MIDKVCGAAGAQYVQMMETRAALDELRAAIRARQHAEQELAGLYRERAIARARIAERDPALRLH